MTKEEIQQRIRYLVEFGGVYEDPIDELRRQIRLAMVLSAVGLLVTWVVIATLH